MPEKKVILITGGARGLGRTISRFLASSGHTVYATTRNPSAREADGVRFLKLDLGSDSSCENVVAEILQREKRLDVVVNNAGITLTGPTLGFSVDDLKNILEVNLIGPYRLLKSVFSHPAKPELVVNVTSLSGLLVSPNFGLYCASKFAMEALGLALRQELAPSTKVVNVAPGALIAENPQKMAHKPARERIPLLKWLMPLTTHETVAIAIGKLIDAPSVPPRILVGADAHICNLAQKILPASIFDKLTLYIWRKK